MSTISHESCKSYLLANLNARIEDFERQLDAHMVPNSGLQKLLALVPSGLTGLSESVNYELQQPVFTAAYGTADVSSFETIGTLRFDHYHDGGVYSELGPTHSTITLRLKRQIKLKDVTIPKFTRIIKVDNEGQVIDDHFGGFRGIMPLSGMADIIENYDIKRALPLEWLFNPYKNL